jgi:hypothetical protein
MRTCSICGHPDRASIDTAILAGGTNRGIARSFGLSDDALRRHAARHLELATSDAKRARDRDLFAEIEGLLRRVTGALNRAERQEDDRVLLLAVREQRATLELLGKLRGDLNEPPRVSVLLGDPQWLAIFAAIRGALTPYPGALADVDQAVARLEAAS